MVKGDRLVVDSALTALAPAVWGSTYLVTTELLPPGRPLLAATVRALPAGLVLLAVGGVLPRGVWWWRALVLGVLNIGVAAAVVLAQPSGRRSVPAATEAPINHVPDHISASGGKL